MDMTIRSIQTYGLFNVSIPYFLGFSGFLRISRSICMYRTFVDVVLAMVAGALLFFGVSAQVRAQSGDPTGFTDQLNIQRVARGLSLVSYNPNYVNVSAQNNILQAAHGLGHHFLGGLAQCSGIGHASPQSVLSDWSQSPGHANILFGPGLTSVGYHQLGTCHTVSCSMSYASQAPVASYPAYQYNVRYQPFRRFRWRR
jgi:hypothetical protein